MTPTESPAPRRKPWGGLFALAMILGALVGTTLAGRRAARLDGLVAAFQAQRDQYVVGVCHDRPQLASVPAWANDLRARCAPLEPEWGSEAPARNAVANAALTEAAPSGFAATLGHLIRTFNPVVLLEIFVALTVGVFVLLGVRGGETPAETVLSRLGGPLRERFVRTAQQAALVGLVVAAASLVAGTWASELEEEKRICHETAVSYGFLVGIDHRCATLMDTMHDALSARDAAVAAKERCEVANAENVERLNAESSIEKTAGHLESSLRDETDARTKVLLEAVQTSFKALAEELAKVDAETQAARAEGAKEKSLAAAQAAVQELAGTVATKAGQDQLAKDVAKAAVLDQLAKTVAHEDTVAALAKDETKRADALENRLKTLDDLKGQKCVVRADLDPLEKALQAFTKPAPAATTTTTKAP